MQRYKKYLALAAIVALPTLASAFPIAAAGTEGLSVIANGTDPIIATYLGNSAAYSDSLFLAVSVASSPGDLFVFNNHTSPVGSTFNLGSFTAGTELIFRMYVAETYTSYYTGDASRNPDGKAHARVESDYLVPGTTLVSFEDLFGTPEAPGGYNDLSFSFTNTTSAPAVPEPASIALFSVGLLGLGFMKRKKS